MGAGKEKGTDPEAREKGKVAYLYYDKLVIRDRVEN